MTFTEQQENRFFAFSDGLKAFGYWIAAEPIEGQEEVFLADLKAALSKVEETAVWVRKRYGYRGMSNNVLVELHRILANPSFNVEVDN